MINPPTIEQIEKWSRLWQQVKQTSELRTQIKICDQKIDSQHHQSQTELNMASLQIDAQPEQALAFVQSTLHEVVDDVEARDDMQKRARRRDAIDIVIDRDLSKLKAEMGDAMTTLGLQPPWSEENQASRKYHAEDKVLMPLSIRFLKGLRELKENNFDEFIRPGQEDGQEENAKAHLQDMYCLTFYAPNPRQSSNTDLEALRRRIMHQDQANSAPNLFRPKYPVMLRSASVAMTTYLLEVEEDQSRKLSTALTWVTSAVAISSFGLLKATLALLKNQEAPWVINDASWIFMVNTALDNGDSEIVSACMSILDNNHTLRNAALLKTSLMGDEAIVGKLIEAGVDVNITDNQGKTALMSATHNRPSAVVGKLIRAGADVNAKDEHGFTALMCASMSEHGEVVEELIKAGANIDARNNYGVTALMIACDRGHETVISKLIEAGASVDARNNIGLTALMVACGNGDEAEAVVGELIEAGADVNAKDNDGDTALMVASYGGHYAVVLQSILAGADLDIQKDNGRTALMIAIEKGHKAVATLLILKKADVNAKDKCGDTALTIAMKNGNNDIVKELQQHQSKTLQHAAPECSASKYSPRG